MNSEDKKWRAESDARTLASAMEIKQDRDRLVMAQKAALDMARKVQKEARNMVLVSGIKQDNINHADSGVGRFKIKKGA